MSSLWALFSKYFLHLNTTLGDLINTYHSWTLLLIFAVLFCETGLVVTPFLPGDSLLFAAGTFAGKGDLPIFWLWLVLFVAPVCGDSANYWIGRFIGPRILRGEKTRFLNKEHLERAHAFYEKYGGISVAIGRFMPIIRTFVPFVAGIGRMRYLRFLAYSICGTLAWVSILVFAGYFFGQVPFVQKHFEIVILAIIVISMIPSVVGYMQHRREMKKNSGPARDVAAAPEAAEGGE
jgi:membrane-associated protein